jgi:hypothetical protein
VLRFEIGDGGGYARGCLFARNERVVKKYKVEDAAGGDHSGSFPDEGVGGKVCDRPGGG